MSGACLVLGAGGRVGRLLRGLWAPATGGAPVLFHARDPGPGIDIAGALTPDLAGQVADPVATVLVLAGAVAGDEARLAGNTRAARQALDLARRLGAGRVLLCSSGAVYGPGSGTPLTTGDAAAATAPYPLAKRAMELAAADWCAAEPDLPAVLCLRLANVAGADALADAVRSASLDAPLRLDRLPGGGSPRRSYLSPATLARLAAAAPVPAARFETVNLAEPGPPLPMSELLDALARAGHPVPWGWRPAPASVLACHALDPGPLADRHPGIFAAPGADALVADWLLAGGGRP